MVGTQHYSLTSSPEEYTEIRGINLLHYRLTDVIVKGKYPYHVVMKKEDLKIMPENTFDLKAVSYYKSGIASTGKTILNNLRLEGTSFDWTINPMGFRIMLNTIYEIYTIPIMVIKNGLGTYNTLENNKVYSV